MSTRGFNLLVESAALGRQTAYTMSYAPASNLGPMFPLKR